LSVLSQPSLFGPPQRGGSARANVDGGSRGNPGPAGYGVRIEQDDGSVVELKESIGIATNNVAEYSGLIAALAWAVEHGVSRLHVRADSDLLVKQMRGEYRVKSPGLQPLFEHARALFSGYRFVRPLGRLSAGAAWNHALELSDGGYYLGLEAGTILAPFAVAHLIKAAGHAQATIVSCPGRARAT
jgi:hypothetical protein